MRIAILLFAALTSCPEAGRQLVQDAREVLEDQEKDEEETANSELVNPEASETGANRKGKAAKGRAGKKAARAGKGRAGKKAARAGKGRAGTKGPSRKGTNGGVGTGRKLVGEDLVDELLDQINDLDDPLVVLGGLTNSTIDLFEGNLDFHGAQSQAAFATLVAVASLFNPALGAAVGWFKSILGMFFQGGSANSISKDILEKVVEHLELQIDNKIAEAHSARTRDMISAELKNILQIDQGDAVAVKPRLFAWRNLAAQVFSGACVADVLKCHAEIWKTSRSTIQEVILEYTFITAAASLEATYQNITSKTDTILKKSEFSGWVYANWIHFRALWGATYGPAFTVRSSSGELDTYKELDWKPMQNEATWKEMGWESSACPRAGKKWYCKDYRGISARFQCGNMEKAIRKESSTCVAAERKRRACVLWEQLGTHIHRVLQAKMKADGNGCREETKWCEKPHEYSHC